jgi:hypothetical protein
MKSCLFVLGMLLLSGAGCLPTMHSTVDANAEAAKKAHTTQRPPTVYAESITADNAHQKASALEAEMDYDMQSAAVPTSPPATR